MSLFLLKKISKIFLIDILKLINELHFYPGLSGGYFIFRVQMQDMYPFLYNDKINQQKPTTIFQLFL